MSPSMPEYLESRYMIIFLSKEHPVSREGSGNQPLESLLASIIAHRREHNQA
jgi:hypothetical protein